MTGKEGRKMAIEIRTKHITHQINPIVQLQSE